MFLTRAVNLFFQIFYYLILARVIMSWLVRPGSSIYNIYGMICQLTEPILAPCCQLLARFGAGRMGIDFSPIVALILMSVIQSMLVGLLRFLNI